MLPRASIILLAHFPYFEENRRLMRSLCYLCVCLCVCITPLTPENILSLLRNGTIKSSATSTGVGRIFFSAALVLNKSTRLVLPRTSCKLFYQKINTVYGLLFKGEGDLYNGGTSKILLNMESIDDGSRVKANTLITYSLVDNQYW
jgi:hypothetical protein